MFTTCSRNRAVWEDSSSWVFFFYCSAGCVDSVTANAANTFTIYFWQIHFNKQFELNCFIIKNTFIYIAHLGFIVGPISYKMRFNYFIFTLRTIWLFCSFVVWGSEGLLTSNLCCRFVHRSKFSAIQGKPDDLCKAQDLNWCSNQKMRRDQGVAISHINNK